MWISQQSNCRISYLMFLFKFHKTLKHHHSPSYSHLYSSASFSFWNKIHNYANGDFLFWHRESDILLAMIFWLNLQLVSLWLHVFTLLCVWQFCPCWDDPQSLIQCFKRGLLNREVIIVIIPDDASTTGLFKWI